MYKEALTGDDSSVLSPHEKSLQISSTQASFSLVTSTQSTSLLVNSTQSTISTQSSSSLESAIEIEPSKSLLSLFNKAEDRNSTSQAWSEKNSNKNVYLNSTFFWYIDVKNIVLPIGVGTILTCSADKTRSGVHTVRACLASYVPDKFFCLGNVKDDIEQSAFRALQFCITLAREKNITLPEGYWFYDFNPPAEDKSGPSAGLSIIIATFSKILNKRPAQTYTAEIELDGNLINIGGIERKIEAAKFIGKNKILLSNQNKEEYKNLDPALKEGMDAIFADNFREFYDEVFPE
ncbi:Lon proteolytic domain-containing protein [Meloidogyne graminicola]|uniref:Lon proteolytic domain-containing protein n=1 Tax=Meloidogyne graminicola TaxID=189291 RepID=A0A8S9ZI03_9BILA|nr:Lon proteolytic domain-containing protein [Meloidogyne graminicola]